MSPLVHPASWHLQESAIASAWNRWGTGSGVLVAILDTGVLTTSGAFDASTVSRVDVRGNEPEDDNGHGTSVAGLVLGTLDGAAIGVAPGADLLSVRVLDFDRRGTLEHVLAGVRRAIAAGARVINVSIGLPVASADEDHGLGLLLDAHPDVAVVAAVGNRTTFDFVSWPACCAGVIAVGGLTRQRRFLPDTNVGTGIQVAAPGEALATVSLGGPVTDFRGSSAAAPLVAGWCALRLGARPQLSRQDLFEEIASGPPLVPAPAFMQPMLLDFASP